MTDFDDFDDPQLRSALQRVAGPAPDFDAAFAAVSTRARQVQRRRTVAVAVSSVALVAAAIAFVARPLDHDVKVTPGTDANVTSTTGQSSTTTPTTPAPTTTMPRSSAPPATPSVTNPIVPNAPGTTADDHSGNGGGGGGNGGTSAATASGSETRTFGSSGGSVTVQLTNGTLRIVGGPSAARGYRASVRDGGPNRVRVEFDNSDHRSRITVTARNGHLVAQVNETGQGNDDQGGGGGNGGGSGGGGSGGGGSGGGGSGGGGDGHGGDPPGGGHGGDDPNGGSGGHG
jgi:hypothetical protein